MFNSTPCSFAYLTALFICWICALLTPFGIPTSRTFDLIFSLLTVRPPHDAPLKSANLSI